jgi:hypothetical protein
MATNYYFHKATWDISTNPNNGVKLNTPLVFALTPILGALFLMFLPFVGFVLLGQAIAGAIAERFSGLFLGSMVPGEAHLTGKPAESVKSPTQDEKLENLEKEIKTLRER